MKNIYRVTNPTDSVCEYFEERDNAIAFIVDEFAMAMAFRNDTEGERLTEYMKTHNETPNQYPFKYIIGEVSLNKDFDKPKSIYLVKVDGVEDCTANDDEFLFYDYEGAKACFDNIVNEDREKNADNPNLRYMLSSSFYDRWDDYEGYCVSHLTVSLIEFIEKNGKLVKKVS